MDSLINNPGYHNITKKIVLLLDHETLITCRSVCQSLKTKVDNPYYWIDRCSKIGQPKSLTNSWIDLVQRIEKSSPIEHKFVQCLIKWTLNFRSWAHLELDGFAPLHVAARYGCHEVVEFITSCTENVNPCWILNECTPMHLSAGNGHMNVVKLLASKMENVNIKDDYGRMPIHMAAANGHINVVEFLATKVDNLNVVSDNGSTPMHYAAFEGHAKIVKFLVSKVDNPNYLDNYGLSPYECAIIEENFEVVEILYPYNNYWPIVPAVSMELPISLVFKCSWTKWKKSTSAKQFMKSLDINTVLTAMIYLYFIILEILTLVHSPVILLSNAFPYYTSVEKYYKPATANCILIRFILFIYLCFNFFFNKSQFKNCQSLSVVFELKKFLPASLGSERVLLFDIFIRNIIVIVIFLFARSI